MADEQSVNTPGPSGGRKRVRNVNDWMHNMQKRKRNSGLSYLSRTTKQLVPARCIGEQCRDGCFDKITLPIAQIIHSEFWKIGDFALQNAYLQKCVTEKAVKRRRPQRNPDAPRRQRTTTNEYRLSYKDQQFAVCLKGFLNILDVSHTRVRNALKALSVRGTPTVDLRGRHPCPKKIPDDVIYLMLEHIKSFQTATSHTRSKSPQTSYLPSNLNIKKIYRRYLSWMNENHPGETRVKLSFYRMHFHRLNLGAKSSSTDSCDTFDEPKLKIAQVATPDKEALRADCHHNQAQVENPKNPNDVSVTKDLSYSAEELESQEFKTIEEELSEESFCAEEGENQDYFRSDSCVAEDSVELSTGSVSVTPEKMPGVTPDTRPGVKPVTVTSSQAYPVTDIHSPSRDDDVILPEGWKQTLPEADHHWISRALFKLSKHGKAELAYERVDKLWWYPLQPSLIPSQLPQPDQYFAQRLLLWMPHKLWQVCLCCPNPSCEDHQLTSAGLYPRVRQVLDIDSFYHLAAEYLECGRCEKKLISWNGAITRQLDLGYRVKFPVLLSHRYACDLRVASLMRPRILGNRATRLRHLLVEQHKEKWSQKVFHYLTDCHTFTSATAVNLLFMPKIREPPPMPEVPRTKWLQTIYCNDVIMRLDEVKAAITSVFGNVLKMDSTKKVMKNSE